MNYRQKEVKHHRKIRLMTSLVIGSLTCGLLIAFVSIEASGQVIIVPSRLRSERGAGKNRSKMKKEAANRALPITVDPETEDVADQLSPLKFPISLPDFGAVSTMVREVTEKPETPVVELLLTNFKVLSTDDRGRVIETRIESTRFYRQELPGAVSLEMVELHGGTFMMGADRIELESVRKEYVRGVDDETRDELISRIGWETPQHQVNVSGIFMSRYEITQAQWRAVAGLPKIEIDLISDPSVFKGGNRPVENVSWAEAVEFCARLSKLTGLTFRLPTEAEWEYACRAGTDTPFNSGPALHSDWSNFNGRRPYGPNSKGEFREQTVPVGSLGVANAFGLYDMHGNVWEWTEDGWMIGQVESNSNLRVLRGGGWDSAAGECRSGARQRMDLNHRSNNLGFRVVTVR